MSPLEGKRIGIIGAGNMGEAFICGLIQSGLIAPDRITAADLRPERLADLTRIHGIATTSRNERLFLENDIVILAVKPKEMPALLSAIAHAPDFSVTGRKQVLSVVAGFSLARMEALLYPPLAMAQQRQLPLLRVMPNTPALVRCGMSAFSANRWANEEDRGLALAILGSLGRVLLVPENDLDAVTALSGSGPAYVFFLIEQMIRGGVEAGLTTEIARILALQTVKGAAALMEAGSDSAEELRRKVTSPGGTTEAAFGVLDARQVGPAIVEAIAAAKRRSAELGAR